MIWYVRRLQTMSAPEIVWRVGSVVRARLSRSDGHSPLDAWTSAQWETSLAAFRRAADRPRLLDRERARDIARCSPELIDDVIAAADRAVALEVQYFGYPAVRLAVPVDWNHDPVGDVAWPVRAASSIDHRTFAGDPKWIWELNRLQHLPWLAQAWLFTDDLRYADAAAEQLDSWLIQNPPGTGIAWRGAFEAGVRAISVAVALAGLRDCDAIDIERYRAIVSMLDASARRCASERSRFSSANNHLVGEVAGLATIAIMHPDLPDAAAWEAIAVDELVREADLQILPDGVGAEQAVGYQIFTAELLLVVVALLHDRDGTVPLALLAAVERGAQFLATVGEPAPRFGDDDEGFALRLGPEPLRTPALHLDLVAGLHTGPGTDETTAARAWFARVGDAPVRPGDVGPPVSTAQRTAGGSAWFPDGGLAVLRSGGTRVTVDAAPLGYLAIAAHGHADALSVTVAHDGRDIIGDPGTGSYYGNPNWRSVMRGTSAHATLTVDDTDQSEPGGAFLWTRHARTRLRAVDLEAGVVDAEHRGYDRLAEPVVHRRWVIMPPQGSTTSGGVLIVDLVSGSGRHDLATTWPLHPDLDVVGSESGFDVFAGTDQVARISSVGTTAGEPYAIRGDTDHQRGWWSRRLESRDPCWWVGYRVRDSAMPFVCATFVDVTTGFPLRYELSVRHCDGFIVVERSRAGAPELWIIDTMLDGQVRLRNESTA